VKVDPTFASFYLIRTGFRIGELVSLVESILRLFSLEWIAQKVGVLPKM